MDKIINGYNNLSLPIASYIQTYSQEQQIEILEYLQQLDDHHKKTYKIAFEHLGSSFNVYKSNGFKEWKASKNK